MTNKVDSVVEGVKVQNDCLHTIDSVKAIAYRCEESFARLSAKARALGAQADDLNG